ncbi:MAG: hypothetical protein R3F37_03535 [Candidatus Competibacteraceae bacterium]
MKRAAVLADLSTLRARLARSRHAYGLKSTHEDGRRFRDRLENRWGLEKSFDNLCQRVKEIEDAERTPSAMHTQRLVNILSTWGLPFIISSVVTNFLQPWLTAWLLPAGNDESMAWRFVGIYFLIAGTLILLVRLYQRFKDWRIKRRRQILIDQPEPEWPLQ